MENKVGDTIPTAKELATLHAELAAWIERARKFCVAVDPDDRKRQLHWRTGAEPHITRVHDLAAKYAISLKGIPLDGMAADRALKVALEPFVPQLKTALRLLEDTAGQAESEAWQAFLAYYGVLVNMADHNPELAIEMADPIAFMATGPQKRPQTK